MSLHRSASLLFLLSGQDKGSCTLGAGLGWERRRNKVYFFVGRKIDGRVEKSYIGSGMPAQLAAATLKSRCEKRALALEHRRLFQRRLAVAEELIEEFYRSVTAQIEVSLASRGYHNPKSRGWRTKQHHELQLHPAS